ncbi:MAG: hypothetical protein V8S42_04345 [Lachnospiraceae bacterium]
MGIAILYHFGEQPPEKVSAARKQKIADGYKRRNREFYIDDITWKDLQMDEVYDRSAFVETQAGEESLYEILRTPLTDPELLLHRENYRSVIFRNIQGKGQHARCYFTGCQ